MRVISDIAIGMIKKAALLIKRPILMNIVAELGAQDVKTTLEFHLSNIAHLGLCRIPLPPPPPSEMANAILIYGLFYEASAQ